MRGGLGGSGGLGATLMAGAAIGIVQIGFSISLASLIFAGPLADGAGRAATAFTVGTLITTLVVGLTSSIPGAIVGAQDTAAIVLAAVATSMAATDLDPQVQLATVYVTVALSAVVAAGLFWAIGHRRGSSFVRYMPWPVVAGFSAGTGWLLIKGGAEVVIAEALHLGDLGPLLEWSNLAQLLPGIGLGVAMVTILKTRVSNIWVGIVIMGTGLLIHGVGRLVSSPATLERDGWLIGPFEDERWTPVTPDDLQVADWATIADHGLAIAAVVAVSVLGVLLNLSGIETIVEVEADLDREMRLVGVANIGVAAAGGTLGWHLMGDTVLANQLGARGRVLPLTIAAMALTTVVIGPPLIGLTPAAVAGGVLIGVGLNLLVAWAAVTMPRFNPSDRWLSASLLAAIAGFGVLPGVAIGVVLALVMFVRRVGRLDPARLIVDVTGRSSVSRSPEDRARLDALSGSILAVELHGFLFFGSTVRLRELLGDDQALPGLRHVIVDFGRVSGLDSTAAAGLAGLVARLSASGIETTLSSVSVDISEELLRSGLAAHRAEPDLDHAASRCEDQLLGTVRDSEAIEIDMSAGLAERFERRQLAARETLIVRGDPGTELYIVESGRLTAWVASDRRRRVRLLQAMPGAVLGEVAFCRGGTRTANVIADTDAVVLVITRDQFDQMTATDPELAVELQQFMLSSLADRVADTTAMVRDLLR